MKKKKSDSILLNWHQIIADALKKKNWSDEMISCYFEGFKTGLLTGIQAMQSEPPAQPPTQP